MLVNSRMLGRGGMMKKTPMQKFKMMPKMMNKSMQGNPMRDEDFVKMMAEGGPLSIGGKGVIDDENRTFSNQGNKTVFEGENNLPFEYRYNPPREMNITGMPSDNIFPIGDRLKRLGDVGTEGYYGQLHEGLNRNYLGEGINDYQELNNFIPPEINLPSLEQEQPPIEQPPIEQPSSRRDKPSGGLNISGNRNSGGYQYGRNASSRGSINKGSRGAGVFNELFGNLFRKPGSAPKNRRATGGKIKPRQSAPLDGGLNDDYINMFEEGGKTEPIKQDATRVVTNRPLIPEKLNIHFGNAQPIYWKLRYGEDFYNQLNKIEYEDFKTTSDFHQKHVDSKAKRYSDENIQGIVDSDINKVNRIKSLYKNNNFDINKSFYEHVLPTNFESLKNAFDDMSDFNERTSNAKGGRIKPYKTKKNISINIANQF